MRDVTLAHGRQDVRKRSQICCKQAAKRAVQSKVLIVVEDPVYSRKGPARNEETQSINIGPASLIGSREREDR